MVEANRSTAKVWAGPALLVTAFAMGTLLAFVARGCHGIFYLPFVLPAALGWALGLVLRHVRLRASMPVSVPVLAAACLGAAVCYGVYHFTVYGRITLFLADNLSGFIDAAAGGPRGAAVSAYFESKTGHEGFAGYLAFVSLPEHRALHPLGLWALSGAGLVATLVAMVTELVILSGMAIKAASRGQDAQVATERVREVMASIDADTLVAMMQHVDEGEFEQAGRVLSYAEAPAPYKVAISYVPNSADPYELEILEMEQGRYSVRRAQRTLSSWDGQALLDELRLIRGTSLGN